MTFIIGKILWAVATPGNLLILLAAVGIARLVISRRRRGFVLTAAATVALLTIAILPVGQWVIAPLEARFPSPRLPDHVDGIIILGGAVESRISYSHSQLALNRSGDRILEFLALAHRYSDAKLLISGGEGSLLPLGDHEAELIRAFLLREGIAETRILVEDRSRNTYENAVFSRDVAQPRPRETWLLVTSAAHMPRAVGCFRHINWDVLPYPVDYRSEDSPLPGFLLGEHLVLLDFAAKEWVGLVSYRLLGHIDELFPIR
jgi:uncharacterized SAM-binding protein YcdF (DUF218 family)